MKWWVNRPWNDAPTRCDVRRYPQVMMGEVTEADFESAPICRLRLGHKGGHDFTAPPSDDPLTAALREVAAKPVTLDEALAARPPSDDPLDEYRDAAEEKCANCGGHYDADSLCPARIGLVDPVPQWLRDEHAPDTPPEDVRPFTAEARAAVDHAAGATAPRVPPPDYRFYPQPDDVPLAPWGGPAPQPPFAARRGLARAWFVRAAIVVLAVVLVLLLGWVR